MAKLVLLGGGENGHHHTNYETAPFDREIVSLTNKQTPNFLFIGLANKYPDYYYEIMKGIYADKYGCNPCYLTYADIQSPIIAQNKIDNADIIYVGGGNTLHLMRLFRKYGIDKMLEEASNKDKVFCGVSAGAICFCKYGQSDARKSIDESQGAWLRPFGVLSAYFDRAAESGISQIYDENDLSDPGSRS